MKLAFLSRRARTACAVGLATLMLSTLAYADNGKGNNSDNGNGKGQGNGGPGGIPAVPEANAGLVLIPVVAAALFFSTRRLWLAKAGVDAEGQKESR